MIIQPTQKGEFEKLQVRFISILRGIGPANRKPVVIKSDGGHMTFELFGRVTKIDKSAAKPIIYITVYEPGVFDTQGDIAKAEIIKEAAHDAMKNGIVNSIDENHNFVPGAGKLVESAILNSTDDDRYPGIRKGAWVGAIEPSDALLPYLGEITGVSLAGTGIYKEESVTAQKSQKPLARQRARKGMARVSTIN